MTEVDSTEESAGDSPLDYAVLAAEVAAQVTGPRGRAPKLSAVTESLRRRAAGETYPTIAAAVGVSAKRAASWCRAAARIDPRFDAREAKPRKMRGGVRPVTRMFSARIEDELLGLVEKRAKAEGRAVTSVVESALRAYLGRKVAGIETLVRRELRKGLKTELVGLAAAIGKHDAEWSRQGNNFNQLVHFVNTYEELPVVWLDELERTRQAHDANRAAIEALHAAVLARFEMTEE